jgi:hypothetical protein
MIGRDAPALLDRFWPGNGRNVPQAATGEWQLPGPMIESFLPYGVSPRYATAYDPIHANRATCVIRDRRNVGDE